MEKVKLKFEYEHVWIDHPLRLITKINDRTLNIDVTGQKQIVIDKELDLPDGDHIFKFEIEFKNESNTKVDGNNNVIEDTLATIKSLQLNDIELLPLIYHGNIQKYYINNQKDNTLEKVLELGFNGTWEFKFKTPVYDWLLESLF